MANSKISILDLSEIGGAIYDIDALYLGGVAAGSYALQSWVTNKLNNLSSITFSATGSEGTYTGTINAASAFDGYYGQTGALRISAPVDITDPTAGLGVKGSNNTPDYTVYKHGNIFYQCYKQSDSTSYSYTLTFPTESGILATQEWTESADHVWTGTHSFKSVDWSGDAWSFSGNNGTTGQVPMVQSDGRMGWGTPSGGGDSYTLPLAASGTRGGIQIGYSPTLSLGNYYYAPVVLSSEKAYVAITNEVVVTALGYTPPLEDTYHSPTFADGIMIGGVNSANLAPLYVPFADTTQQGVVRPFHKTSGTVTGTKTTTATNSPAVNSRSVIAGRYYGVETDMWGTMYVNVPWTDTNTYVTQYYGTGNGDYPLLMSYVPGITSTSSRGGAYAYVNNGLFANPSTSILTATGGITTPNIYTTDSGLTFYVGEDSDPFAQLLWSSEAADEDPEANNRGITTFDTSSYALVFRANDNYGNNANIRIEGGSGGLSTQISLNADIIYANGALNLTNASIQANGSIGTAGQVLTSTGSGVEWAAVDLSNYVTLNTIQTISGLKSFSGSVGFSSVVSFGSNCQIWANGAPGNGNQTLVSDATGTYWDTHIKGYNDAALSSRFSQLVMYVDSNGYLHISAT